MLGKLKSRKLAPFNNILKRLFISFLALIVIYASLRIYLNHILKQVLIAQVEQFSNKNFKLEIGEIDIGWWAYNAHISVLKLSKIKNLKSEKEPYHFTIAASYVKLKGLYLFDLLFNQKLDLRKLEIKDPNINIYYNDTLAPTFKVDSSFNFLQFKLSNIELQNVNIKLEKSSGEIIKLKGKIFDYSFKNKLLQLKQIKLERKNNTFKNIDFDIHLSDAVLRGFDFNVLMNESNFKFTSCKMDSLRINLKPYLDKIAAQEKSNSKFEKFENKSNIPINPISINHFYFSSIAKGDTILSSGDHFNYSNQNLYIENVKFKIVQQHSIQGKLDKLAIKGINIDNFIEKKHAKIAFLKFTKPNIQVDLMVQKNYLLHHKKTSQSTFYSIDIIENLEIEQGHLTLQHYEQKKLKIDINAIQLAASKFNPNYDKNGQYYQLANQLTFATGKTFLNFPNNLYQLNLSEIKYNLSKETMAIKDLSVHQNGKKKEFHAKVKKQIAMINLTLKTLSLSGLNINKLLKENKLTCNEINAGQFIVSFYKDKNIPLLANDYRKFPQELLRDITYPISIKKCKIKDATLISEILNPGAGNIAKLSITKVQAAINHIDNQLYAGNKMQVNFEGRIANAGLLKANAFIDMFASDFKHTVHAEIGSMPFNYLNEFMIDFASVEINKGNLDKAVIDIVGNKQNINCKLELSYHDLKMDILRNPNKKNKRYRPVASILANSIIYNNNPEPGKPLRRADVSQDYISNRFIIGNWINISLKAMLLTTAPAAASALQISNTEENVDSLQKDKSPKWLKRFIQRKRAK
jgi:hypothetical protein